MCIRTFLNASKISTEQVFVYTFHQKKMDQKNIFFSEKNHFENFDFRFFFRISKKNLENQKIDFQKKTCFFDFSFFSQNVDFFLKIEIFKIIFLQEKLLFFAPIFF